MLAAYQKHTLKPLLRARDGSSTPGSSLRAAGESVSTSELTPIYANGTKLRPQISASVSGTVHVRANAGKELLGILRPRMKIL